MNSGFRRFCKPTGACPGLATLSQQKTELASADHIMESKLLARVDTYALVPSNLQRHTASLPDLFRSGRVSKASVNLCTAPVRRKTRLI